MDRGPVRQNQGSIKRNSTLDRSLWRWSFMTYDWVKSSLWVQIKERILYLEACLLLRVLECRKKKFDLIFKEISESTLRWVFWDWGHLGEEYMVVFKVTGHRLLRCKNTVRLSDQMLWHSRTSTIILSLPSFILGSFPFTLFKQRYYERSQCFDRSRETPDSL